MSCSKKGVNHKIWLTISDTLIGRTKSNQQYSNQKLLLEIRLRSESFLSVTDFNICNLQHRFGNLDFSTAPIRNTHGFFYLNCLLRNQIPETTHFEHLLLTFSLSVYVTFPASCHSEPVSLIFSVCIKFSQMPQIPTLSSYTYFSKGYY